MRWWLSPLSTRPTINYDKRKITLVRKDMEVNEHNTNTEWSHSVIWIFVNFIYLRRKKKDFIRMGELFFTSFTGMLIVICLNRMGINYCFNDPKCRTK